MNDTIPSFTECVIGYDWTEPTHVLYDSRTTARATAVRITASDHGIDFTEAKCCTVYARWLTRQEIWDNGAGERWWDDQGEMVDGKWVPLDDGTDKPPDTPPEDWQPDPERDATFELCGKDASDAVKCWQVSTGL